MVCRNWKYFVIWWPCHWLMFLSRLVLPSKVIKIKNSTFPSFLMSRCLKRKLQQLVLSGNFSQFEPQNFVPTTFKKLLIHKIAVPQKFHATRLQIQINRGQWRFNKLMHFLLRSSFTRKLVKILLVSAIFLFSRTAY